jgi:hypothetical protein
MTAIPIAAMVIPTAVMLPHRTPLARSHPDLRQGRSVGHMARPHQRHHDPTTGDPLGCCLHLTSPALATRADTVHRVALVVELYQTGL